MTKLRLATFSSLAALLLWASVGVAAEDITVDFTYERNVNIGTIVPTLKLPAFADERGLDDPNLITADYRAQNPLAEIMRDAFIQGFSKGGVEFVESGEDMQIVGTLISSELESMDRSGVPSLRLTIRTRIELKGGGRTIWENTLFGRGTVAEEDGIAAAVNASLERTVRELLRDDYFLIEVQ